MLYSSEDGGRMLLDDFDGVGRDEVDRYSTCLNPKRDWVWLGGRS